MPSHKNRVQMTVTGTPGTGTITLNAASSGYQTFAAAYAANATVDILITDGTAWEVARNCTYTNSGTTVTRGTLEASSTGSAISLTSAAVVSVIATATRGNVAAAAMQSLIPGGRLTLESGVPVSSTDQDDKTTIYYTPYVHNVISLWDGADWVPTVFAEVSEALGTLTASRPYDVFGFLSSGVLDIELLAWTSDTARATAVTLQDGRHCKSGDKTRLLLGTFWTKSTTTTADTAQRRFVDNVYNQVPRRMFQTVAGETTTSSTVNEIDNAGGESYPRLGIVASLLKSAALGGTFSAISTAANDLARCIMYQNGSAGTGLFTYDAVCNTSTSPRFVGVGTPSLTPGYHYVSMWCARQSGTGTVTFGTAQQWGSVLT